MVEPVLTVTANTALDRVILVEDFSFGKTVVAKRETLAMAGKPADVSLVLAKLGVSSLATGLAGGSTGDMMKRKLEEAGVCCSFLRTRGSTRINVVIVKEGTGEQGTVTVPSLKPTEEDGEKLLAHVEKLLPGRRWLVLGGSLPAGVAPNLYGRMIAAARAMGVPSLIDAGGEALNQSLPYKPTIVKPNRVELAATVGHKLTTTQDTIAAAREICAEGAEIVAVTMGQEGSICVTADDAWYVPPVPVRVVNTAGAGDAFDAGLIKGLLDGKPLPEALRWATAAATAVLLTLGTAECHRDDVQALLPRVEVCAISHHTAKE